MSGRTPVDPQRAPLRRTGYEHTCGGGAPYPPADARRGLRGWTANTEVVLPGYGRALGDVVFEEEKVIAEVDGWAYHRDLRAFLVDGPRQSTLAAEGWVVLRTHWHELVDAPEAFLERLRRTLASRSPVR